MYTALDIRKICLNNNLFSVAINTGIYVSEFININHNHRQKNSATRTRDTFIKRAMLL